MTERQAVHESRCLLSGIAPLLQQIIDDYPEFETQRERARLREINKFLEDTQGLMLTSERTSGMGEAQTTEDRGGKAGRGGVKFSVLLR